MAGADVWLDDQKETFKYPSYVEDIMGPLCFDYGFGPFRWVCTSGNLDDLQKSDHIAASVIKQLILKSEGNTKAQYEDNLKWIQTAESNLPIVGSKSRILYADTTGRIEIAKAFNESIKVVKFLPP